MRRLLTILSLALAVTLPAFSQTVKFSHEGQTNLFKLDDEFLINAHTSGTAQYVTWRAPGSNVLSQATNFITVAAGANVTVTTNFVNGQATYTVASTGGGGGLPTTAPVWSRFTTNASYTLTTNFYVHGWTAISIAGTITLPSASACSNLHLVIKDQGGNCSATNLTIAAASGDRIDGSTTNVINTNYGAKSLYSAGSTNWFVY